MLVAGFNGGNGGVNLPTSKYPATSITYASVPGTNDHRIVFGADILNGLSEGDIMSPAKALALDEKIDDSNPSVGKFRAGTSDSDGDALTFCTVLNGAGDDDDTYAITQPGANCFVEVRH